MWSEREKFLEEINKHLPRGVDWKLGAIEYLRSLIKSEGSRNELYHLIKPFLGGPDFSPFFLEMYGFLNMLDHVKLPMKSKVLDVACGPGWTSHFLAKLGYQVYGVDISEELIEIAKQRISCEPFQVYEEIPLSAEFKVIDIEENSLDIDTVFDAAFFESALHHFYNPIKVIENISRNLKLDGIICSWEGAAPSLGSEPFNKNMELMEKYHTIERPYTRQQVINLLKICGFSRYEFYSQVNGLFNPNHEEDIAKLNEQLVSGQNWNIFIASRKGDFFKSRPLTKRKNNKSMIFDVARAFLSLMTKDNDSFIISMYDIFLNREPDIGGKSVYQKRLNNIFSRFNIVYSFLISQEYKNLKSLQ